MDLALDVEVFCNDGRCGRSTNVILNPITCEVTHLVVALETRPHTEYVVPTSFLGETTPGSINLHCTTTELKALEPFVVEELVAVETPQYDNNVSAWPLVTSETKWTSVVHHHIPLGELAVRRGARVEAADGSLGNVEEFLVDEHCRVTHLVLGKGHLWRHKDIAIPASEIESYEEKTVRVRLSKQAVNGLPAVEIHR
jgi:hypothetical protein